MRTAPHIRLVALAAAAIVLASCGGDGATSLPEPDPDPSLAFASQPVATTAGMLIGPVQVRVVDAGGDIMSESSVPVTIAIAQGTGAAGGVLKGTLTRNAVQGVATFDGLTIEKAGRGYKLTVTSSGIDPVTSSAFDIAHSVASRMVAASSPTTATAGEMLAPFVVRIEDVFGNTVTNATNAVTLSLVGGAAGAQLNGTLTRAPLAGVVTFNDLTINRMGTGFTLTASAVALPSVTSASFNTRVSVRFVSGASQTGLDGFDASDIVVIEVQDPIGTFLTAAPVTWSTTGGTLTSSGPVTNSIGRAGVRWRLGAGTQSVTASVLGSSVTTTAIGLTRGSCAFNSTVAGQAFPVRDTLRFAPMTRRVKVAVLFIDFPDLTPTRTVPQMMTDIINPAVQMLSATTDGKMQIDLVPTSSWMRMPESADSLRPRGVLPAMEYFGIVLDRHDPTFDFSAIDVVWIVRPSRLDPLVSGVTTFFQSSPQVIRYDGRALHRFVSYGVGPHLIDVYPNWPGYGRHVVAHEMGHVYGLPDLYEYDPVPGADGIRFTGGWSFMGSVAQGTSLTAAERSYIGALPDTDVLCPPSQPFSAVVTLRAIEETSGLRGIGLRSTATRMTFLESRHSLGMDAGFCSTGLLVYDVNGAELLGDGPIRVREVRPSAAGAEQDRCGSKWNAPAQAGDVIALGDPNVEVSVVSRAADGSITVRITRQ